MKLRKILRYELSMIYNSMVYNLKIYRKNKLGQRQSQTPFSSAFWVKKRFWVHKSVQILGPKHFGSRKFLGPKIPLIDPN